MVFAAALAGATDGAGRTSAGDEIRDHGATWSTPEGFAAYVRWLRDLALEDSPRPEGYVPSTTLWWIDGEEYLGRLAIRTPTP